MNILRALLLFVEKRRGFRITVKLFVWGVRVVRTTTEIHPPTQKKRKLTPSSRQAPGERASN